MDRIRLATRSLGAILLLSLGACASDGPSSPDRRNVVVVSVKDQKLTVVKADQTRETFAISTSKFGLGDRPRSYATPLGNMEIAGKIGAGAPVGAVFHGRARTGEIVDVDAPGRDPIVTRIIRLKGLESQNARAADRGIYIHGTPEEGHIGRPASYGCIRMRSRDVIRLFNLVAVGSRVTILDSPLNNAVAQVAPSPAPVVKPAEAGAKPVESAPAMPAGPSVAVLTDSSDRKGDRKWAGDADRLLAGDAPAGDHSRAAKPAPRRKAARAQAAANNGAM